MTGEQQSMTGDHTTGIVRAAMTQTCNVYAAMPGRVDDLASVADRLGDIRDANIEHHLELIRCAAAMGVRAIGLGELFAGPYFALGQEAVWHGLAEDAPSGPTAVAMGRAAREHGMVIVAPIYELDAASGKRYNTALVFDADGSMLGRYRKTHIPMGTNEQGSFDERFYYEPGRLPQNEPSPKILGDNPYFPVFDTTVGRIGVAICYDRHFEGVMSTLARSGAELIFSPAVTFGEQSQRMWPLEFAVDAARHRVFIGGSNRCGAESPWNQAFFGDSHFVGPGGRLVDLSDDPRLVVSDCSLASLAGPDPSGWNLARDRRPDIYGV